MAIKLTLEEKEDLADLLHHEGVTALFKELDACLELMEASVLKYNLNDSSDIQKLINLKCRAEGASQLAQSLRNRLDAIKRQNK